MHHTHTRSSQRNVVSGSALWLEMVIADSSFKQIQGSTGRRIFKSLALRRRHRRQNTMQTFHFFIAASTSYLR